MSTGTLAIEITAGFSKVIEATRRLAGAMAQFSASLECYCLRRTEQQRFDFAQRHPNLEACVIGVDTPTGVVRRVFVRRVRQS